MGEITLIYKNRKGFEEMKRSFFKYVAVILVIVMLSSISAFAAGYTPAEKAQLKFNADGEFKIMQITDVQDNFHLRKIAKTFIRYAVEQEKPDLVVLTGDNVAGYWSGSVLFPEVDRTMVKECIDNLMEIFEEYYDQWGLRVAVVFGNHDDQLTWVTKEEQIVMYSQYDCFIGYDEAIENIDIYGCGNYMVPIFSSDYTPVEKGDIDYTNIAYNLMMIDSNTYTDFLGLTDYDAVHDDQLKWFEGETARINALAGKEVSSMVFQHIIVPDIYDALVKVDEGTEGAVQGEDGNYYVLPEGAKGTLGEAPCPPSRDVYNNEYERLINVGAEAFFFGHDHNNDFEVSYKGATMYATSGVGFCSYGNELRGVRVINLKENGDDVTYDTEMIYYEDEDGFSSDEGNKDEITANASERNFFERIIAWIKTMLRRWFGIR